MQQLITYISGALILLLLISEKGYGQYVEETVWEAATHNEQSVAKKATLYHKNGLKVSFRIYEAKDQQGRSLDICKINPIPGVPRLNSEEWADDKPIHYYRIRFAVENLNKDKMVDFRQVSSIMIDVENPSEPMAHTCSNSTGTSIHALANITTMRAGSKLVFDQANHGDWFFSKPKVTRFRIGQHVLKPDQSNAQNLSSGSQPDIEEWLNGLENSLAKDGEKKTIRNTLLQDKMEENISKILPAASLEDSALKTDSGNSINHYDEILCQEFERKAKMIMSKLSNMTSQAFRGNSDLPNMNRNSNESIAFSNDYIRAINQNKLSPDCVNRMQKIFEQSSTRFMNQLDRMN